VDVVTGAFSFTGRYVAARLLESGREVRTLTRRPQSESPFGDRVRAFPLDFTDPGPLRGADTSTTRTGSASRAEGRPSGTPGPTAL